MVSWGPCRKDGNKFYSGQRDAPPWVRDLNWKNRCKLETSQLEEKRRLNATRRTQILMGTHKKTNKLTSSGKLRMKMGSHGTMIPEDDNDTLLEKLAFQVQSKKPLQVYTLNQQPETERSIRSRQFTGRSAGRSTARSSQQSMSSIGSLNTEMREIIRDTAAAEIQELRQALVTEAELRAKSDAKIEGLLQQLVALRNQKK